MKDARSIYERRKTKYDKLFKKQEKASNMLSSIRMFVFVLGVIATIVAYYKMKNIYTTVGCLLIFLIIFLVVAVKHNKLIEKKEFVQAMIEVNKKALMRLDDKWNEFTDNGEEYLIGEHPYSGDLDIFGNSSLYQYINETSTYMGKINLRDRLSCNEFSIEEIYERQQGIKELTKSIGFRQKFSAQGIIKKGKESALDKLISWSEDNKYIDISSGLMFLVWGLPIVTIALIVMYFMGMYKNYYIPLLFTVIQYGILKIKKDERDNSLDTINFYSKSLNDYHILLQFIENQKFKGDYLKGIQGKIKNDRYNASQAVKELSKLSNIVSDRKNFMYTLFNILTLWDYNSIIKLQKWKKSYSSEMKQWLNSLGEIDALNSLAIIGFDNPNWCYPKFNKNALVLKGKNMAHPLLGKNKIYNNLTIGNEKTTLLITGSNMSGKSTLLRTSGINLVLAYTGAPVCASEFNCSLMDIYTCMRISDNLEKNISSFYGELLRIKGLMEAVKEKRPVFFLLDEIFKGTNSMDRHTGAKILINKLTKENAIGMVSTHDLELGDLEQENVKVKNYHLREYYKNNKICFDYKIREGVSTTRNAIYLMKMVGIDMDNN